MTRKRVVGDGTKVLATDLDGTLIPLPGNHQNQDDLQRLAQLLADHQITLVYITGRHFASVQDAIDRYQLPRPEWVICDVGTSIFHARDTSFELLPAYRNHLRQIVSSMSVHRLQELLSPIKDLKLQESQKQGEFKLSFYTDATRIDEIGARVVAHLDRHDAPYRIIQSVDPFTGDGLIDCLPMGVSKASALSWWTQHVSVRESVVVFAGDSGNDLAALTAGYRAVLVANADRQLADQVEQAHAASEWRNRLLLARQPATSGVLEGCHYFNMFTDL